MPVIIAAYRVIAAKRREGGGVNEEQIWAGGRLSRGRERALEYTRDTGHSTYVVGGDDRTLVKYEAVRDEHGEDTGVVKTIKYHRGRRVTA